MTKTDADRVNELLDYNGELQREVDALRTSLAEFLILHDEHVARCTNQQCCVRVIKP